MCEWRMWWCHRELETNTGADQRGSVLMIPLVNHTMGCLLAQTSNGPLRACSVTFVWEQVAVTWHFKLIPWLYEPCAVFILIILTWILSIYYTLSFACVISKHRISEVFSSHVCRSAGFFLICMELGWVGLLQEAGSRSVPYDPPYGSLSQGKITRRHASHTGVFQAIISSSLAKAKNILKCEVKGREGSSHPLKQWQGFWCPTL